MTLNAKIGGFMDFLVIWGCETFQERIVPKPTEIDMDKLCIKFSALNVDFGGPSLDFYVQGNFHTRASKSGRPTPEKVIILLLLSINCYRLSRVS